MTPSGRAFMIGVLVLAAYSSFSIIHQREWTPVQEQLIGPALVIFLWGTHAPRWQSVPVYAAALAAQFLFDYVSQFLMLRPVLGISALAQLRSSATSRPARGRRPSTQRKSNGAGRDGSKPATSIRPVPPSTA